MSAAGIRVWRADGVPGPVRRTGGDARELLLGATRRPTVRLYPRCDGPGSSQDLPQFVAMANRIPSSPVDLDDPAWRWSRGSLRTPGACIDAEPIVFEAAPAEDARATEYYAPDFHDRPVVARSVVEGRPELFVNNILEQFGLRGVRIEAQPMPALYRGTGLGGSNLAHLAALILASTLSGAGLNLGQIHVYGALLENEFGVRIDPDTSSRASFGVSLTGGQEALTALQGGFFDNVHLPQTWGPFAVVSRELVEPSRYDDLRRHLLLINVGRQRSRGTTSAAVNETWMAAWRTADGARGHQRKKEVAYLAAESLRCGDWPAYVQAVATYRTIREQLCPEYLAGQDELADLCRRLEAEYFPLGAGTGTCLVAAADEAAIAAVREHIDATAEPASGRVALEFRVRRSGYELAGLEELGLEAPRGPELA